MNNLQATVEENTNNRVFESIGYQWFRCVAVMFYLFVFQICMTLLLE